MHPENKYLTISNFILFVFLSFTCTAQSPEIDSLKNLLKTNLEDDVKMEIYADLSDKHIYIDPTIAKKYNDTLSSIATELNNEKYIYKSKYNASVILSRLGNFEESIDILTPCFAYYIAQQDSINLAKAYYQLGASNIRIDNMDEAIESLIVALKITDKTDDLKMKSSVLNALAIVYKNTYQTKKALHYFNKAIELCFTRKDTNGLAITYNGAGVLYLHQDSLDKAMYYFENAMFFSEKSNNRAGIGYQHRNMGVVHQKRGEYEQAEARHLKALEIRKKMGQKLTIGGSYSDLGEVCLSKKEYKKAAIYFENALSIFNEMKAVSAEVKIYEQLARLYKEDKQFEKAYSNQEKYYSIRDTLKNNELREKINNLELKYDSEKKDNEIVMKNLEIKEGKKRKTVWTILTGVLFISTLLFWYAFSQSKKRKKQEILAITRDSQIRSLEALLEGEEKERSRIAKELHDGVNGDLSAIKYKLSSMMEQNSIAITDAIKMIDNSCEQVRAISHNLIPPSLEKFNLQGALLSYCERLNVNYDIHFTYQHLGETLALDKNIELNIFRIVQELLTNSIKHAKANEVTVQTSFRNQLLQITIEDNGIGFGDKEIQNKGIGLKNIQSRIDYLNAKTDFTSNKNGTSYLIEMNITSHD